MGARWSQRAPATSTDPAEPGAEVDLADVEGVLLDALPRLLHPGALQLRGRLDDGLVLALGDPPGPPPAGEVAGRSPSGVHGVHQALQGVDQRAPVVRDVVGRLVAQPAEDSDGAAQRPRAGLPRLRTLPRESGELLLVGREHRAVGLGAVRA